MMDDELTQEIRSAMERRMYQTYITLTQTLRDLSKSLGSSDNMRVWTIATVAKEQIDELVGIYDTLNGLEGE